MRICSNNGRGVFWYVLTLVALPGSAATVTFNQEVAPIVYSHCAPCHHAGGIGPFPLITYRDVLSHASQIAAVTKRRYMPPWPPQEGYGDFADNRRLSEGQIRLIAAWVAAGAPEGSTNFRPTPPQFKSEWQLGKPDLVVRMREPYRVPAEGTDVFRNFVVQTGLRSTAYVRGAELRLTNTRVVHHANLVLDRAQSLRKRDGEDGQPGFPGMDIITEAAPNDFDPDSHFLFWKPGTVLRPEPDAMSWRLDPNTDIIVNLHLQPTGKVETIQAEIGLYFAKSPPTLFPMLVQLENDGAIDIPPGSSSFAITDNLTIPVDSKLLAIYPHAHYLGKTVEAWATLPNGHRDWLIRIPDWDINWQAVYEYKNPVLLPRGTKVEMRITYDNSRSNGRNPHNPPRWVRTGNRSQDEMGHVWLQLLPADGGLLQGDGRLLLQESVMSRRLEKYPGDFVATYNLASLLQSRGKFPDAIARYRSALATQPKNTTVRNGLASALSQNGELSEAITQWREVLSLDPDYLNARYNLAHALSEAGDWKGASAEYWRFLERRPDDASAQAGLGTAYVKQKRYGEAIAPFREATRLDSTNVDAWSNLGAALAITGDLGGAVNAFEQALRIDPNQEVARRNLERARAKLAK